LRCPGIVPLYARSKSRVARVGYLKPDARRLANAQTDEIELPLGGDINPFVRRSDLDRCTVETMP
jgi:hypothetical protein